MFWQKCHYLGPLRWGPKNFVRRNFSNVNKEKEETLYNLCKHLEINKSKAQYMCLKHPIINKLSENKIITFVDTVHNLGFSKEALVQEPLLFTMLPVTLNFRYKVLNECGFQNISPLHLVSYLKIIKQISIEELQRSNEIPVHVNVENRLASYMTQWPTSLTTLIYGDVTRYTLFNLRLKIIQRYLELVLDLTEDEFKRGIKTYPTVKHRPLQAINETLTILQSQIMISNDKIKSNLYLIHVDPENLKHIIYNFRSIGGIDIKEIIRAHPKLTTKSYSTLVEIRNILEDYGISNEAQRRCFDIYTLSPSTVRERLEIAKTIPEFNTFFDHPRFLKMIHYKTTVMKRMMTLYNNNKKCLSLNILSGSSTHYETFEKAPGDRLGKGRDLIFCISQSLREKFNSNEVRSIMKRHPFWINIPLIQVKFVSQQLLKEFTPEDIYKNCPILLYPWNKIQEILDHFNEKKQKQSHIFPEHLNLTKLTKPQKLSIVLYLLEKNHYYTGNGVWSEEKCKTIVDVPKLQKINSTTAM